jgi:hypothetical protein
VCPGRPNASRTCIGGVCGYACLSGWHDCNAQAPDGCESNLNDSKNCGACNRGCSPTQVLSKQCTGGVCESYCDRGYSNCALPGSPTVDDGCEVAPVTSMCGSCYNDCSLLFGMSGGASFGNGLECGGTQNPVCGCSVSSDCGDDSGGAEVACVNSLCSCQGLSCRPGETCWDGVITAPDGGAGGTLLGPVIGGACSCGGIETCTSDQTCCQSPYYPPNWQGPQSPGCRALAGDPFNCGACGRVCPPGMICKTSACECNEAADCFAGTSGTCVSGACKCGAQACAKGERCQIDGSCG